MTLAFILLALLGMAGLATALFSEEAPHWVRWSGGAACLALLVVSICQL